MHEESKLLLFTRQGAVPPARGRQYRDQDYCMFFMRVPTLGDTGRTCKLHRTMDCTCEGIPEMIMYAVNLCYEKILLAPYFIKYMISSSIKYSYKKYFDIVKLL